MFFVLRTWCRPWIAFVGGLLFGFSPYMVAQITHLNLIFNPLLPLIVLVMVRLLSDSTTSARRLGITLGVLSGAQLLICPELLAMLGVVCGVGTIAIVVRAGAQWRTRLSSLLRAAPWALASVLVVAGYFLFWAFAGAGHVSGPPQPVAALQSYRTDLLAPVVPTLNQALLPRSLVTTASRFDAGNFTENDGYLGIGLIVWVIVVAVRYRRRKVVLYSALAAALALVLSFGSRLTIDGAVTNVPLPEALFTRIPLLQSFVPARFAEIVALFVAISASVGAECFVRGLQARRTTTRRLGEMSMVLLAGVALALPYPQLALVTKAPRWPHGLYRALNHVPHGSVVLAYPYPSDPYTEAMSWQAQSGFRFKLVGGYMDVPGVDHHGQENPVGLAPVQVQGFLTESLYGHPLEYPPPSASYDLAAGLCTFVRRYHVGALVYWRTGAHPERVRQLFEHDFGRPSASVSRGSIEVWRTPPGSCAAG
ncbi:MAG: glycosyltransferase family protein [Acidimicrobiales bacterium]